MRCKFKAITGTTGYTSWWEITVCHSMETVISFDAGLVALQSIRISPGKGVHHSTLRCHTLPSGENFSRQWPAPWFYDRFFSCQYSATFSFLPRGVTGTSGYHFEYNLHLIKILACTICESIYRISLISSRPWIRPARKRSLELKKSNSALK